MKNKDEPRQMLRPVKEIDIEYRSRPEDAVEGCKQPLYSEIKRKTVQSSLPLVEISKIATYWDRGIPVIYYLNTTDSGGLPVRQPIKFDNMLNKGAIDSSLAFMTGKQKLWENLAKTANLIKPIPWLLIGLIVMALLLGGAFGASLYNPLNHTEPISNAPTKVVVWNVTNTIFLSSSSSAVPYYSSTTSITPASTPAISVVTATSIQTVTSTQTITAASSTNSTK